MVLVINYNFFHYHYEFLFLLLLLLVLHHISYSHEPNCSSKLFLQNNAKEKGHPNHSREKGAVKQHLICRVKIPKVILVSLEIKQKESRKEKKS